MPIKVSCPKCGGVLHAPDDSGGKRGRCPTCGTVLNIPAEAPARTAGASASADDNPFRPAAGPANVGGLKKVEAFGFADVADPPRSAAGAIPAPAFHPPEPRRVPSPSVTRTSLLPGPDDEPLDVAARGWKRVRRGLGWVRTGVVLLVLAVVAPAAVLVVNDKAPGTIPDKNPGYLQTENLTAVEEITLASGLAPAALGILSILVGRAGVARAPRSSYTRGLARLAGFGTLAAVGGLVAAAVPAGLLLSEHVRPAGLADRSQSEGIVQRFGLAAAVGFAVAAEAWFVIALGKIGAALHQKRASARSGRLVALAGVLVAAAIVAWVGYVEYPGEVTDWWAANVEAKWAQLGGDRLTVVAGAAAAGAVIAGIVYLRLVGATRHAVREWLAQHHPG